MAGLDADGYTGAYDAQGNLLAASEAASPAEAMATIRGDRFARCDAVAKKCVCVEDVSSTQAQSAGGRGLRGGVFGRWWTVDEEPQGGGEDGMLAVAGVGGWNWHRERAEGADLTASCVEGRCLKSAANGGAVTFGPETSDAAVVDDTTHEACRAWCADEVARGARYEAFQHN